MSPKDLGPSPSETRCSYNEKGEEIPDPRPLAMPIGFKKPLPLADEIRKLISQGVQRELEEHGIESFDDADNFDLPDEDMSSPWEDQYDSALLWTRDAEIRAGVVEHPSQEQINLAKDILAAEAARQAKKTGGDTQAPKASLPPLESKAGALPEGSGEGSKA